MKGNKIIGRLLMTILLIVNAYGLAKATCLYHSVDTTPSAPCNANPDGVGSWRIIYNWYQGNPSHCSMCLFCENTNCNDGFANYNYFEEYWNTSTTCSGLPESVSGWVSGQTARSQDTYCHE